MSGPSCSLAAVAIAAALLLSTAESTALRGGAANAGPRGATATGADSLACPSPTEETVASGREIFAGSGNCYACHGEDAKGTPIAPDLTDDGWLLRLDGSYAAVAELIREGVPKPVKYSPMPPMGGADLDDSEVCAAAAYVLSLTGPTP